MKAGTMVGQGLKKVRTEIFTEQFGSRRNSSQNFQIFRNFFVQNLISRFEWGKFISLGPLRSIVGMNEYQLGSQGLFIGYKNLMLPILQQVITLF